MLLLLATALAADRVQESDTLAMGSTAVATPGANGMVTQNPGGIGLNDRYDFQMGIGYGERGLHWQVGAVDTKTSVVSFGLVYSGDQYHPQMQTHELPGWSVPGQSIRNRKRFHDLAAALAIPLADRRVSIGLGGSIGYINHDRQGKGVTGNLTVGAAVKPVDELVIGVSGRNLLPLTDPSLDRPLEVLGGMWFGDPEIGSIAIEGGARPEYSKPLVLAAGAQVHPRNAAIRAGWRYESGRHAATLGAGAGTETARMDVGLSVPTASIAKPADWTIQLTFRFAGPDMNSVPEPR